MQSEVLPYLRALKGWSQADLARALGLCRASISKWEGGKMKFLPIHELAIRQLFGDEDYYIAHRRLASGAMPSNKKWRGHL